MSPTAGERAGGGRRPDVADAFDVGLLDHGQVVVHHQGQREAADLRLRGEELTEALAVLSNSGLARPTSTAIAAISLRMRDACSVK